MPSHQGSSNWCHGYSGNSTQSMVYCIWHGCGCNLHFYCRMDLNNIWCPPLLCLGPLGGAPICATGSWICVCVCVVHYCTWHKKFRCHILEYNKLLSLQSLKGLCRAQWAGHCTVQQLPVEGSQLVSHTANTHLNMSQWSPTRSPHQLGANYFSSGEQTGQRQGFSSVLTWFFSPPPSFLFRGVAKCQFTLIWQGRETLGTAVQMCRVTKTSCRASVAF